MAAKKVANFEVHQGPVNQLVSIYVCLKTEINSKKGLKVKILKSKTIPPVAESPIQIMFKTTMTSERGPLLNHFYLSDVESIQSYQEWNQRYVTSK